jgi:hypothetical protein
MALDGALSLLIYLFTTIFHLQWLCVFGYKYDCEWWIAKDVAAYFKAVFFGHAEKNLPL